MKNFSDLKLIEPLERALTEVGYAEMTPVQAASLPAILTGRDVVVQAQTGSGKTAAFALGLLSTLDVTRVQLQCLVLCPTRELADQVSREIRRLACFIPNVKVLTLCGGVPLGVHLTSLAHEPHIVVGTPGRLLELIEKQALPLQALKMLVLDEADRMLDMGFADAIASIIGQLPASRQTLLFSATIPQPIRDISRRLQRDPLDVTVVSEQKEALIEQLFFEVDPSQKLQALAALLHHHRPESAVVFCNTRQMVRTVADDLVARKFSALALHGELDQREREEMLVRFANRSCTVLVASDVAARGLDIAELPMVINVDLASDADTHLHRIGRTGRAGRPGLALNLCVPSDAPRTSLLEEQLGAPLHWDELPSSGRAVRERAVSKGDFRNRDDHIHEKGRSRDEPLLAPYITLAIDAGRQDKLRPGDLLGALTGDAGLPVTAVGKIDVFPTRTYVAIARERAHEALQRLQAGKIKGRRFRIRPLGSD